RQLHRRCPVGLCTIVAGSEGVVQTIPRHAFLTQIDEDHAGGVIAGRPHLDLGRLAAQALFIFHKSLQIRL
ncbi:hypothetical protein, partial [Xanthomonas theicola]|uniref:hypothetical protein n=1 Tax=Xanthomonas theicola TaxID=56464 RepID=UPI001B809078